MQAVWEAWWPHAAPTRESNQWRHHGSRPQTLSRGCLPLRTARSACRARTPPWLTQCGRRPPACPQHPGPEEDARTTEAAALGATSHTAWPWILPLVRPALGTGLGCLQRTQAGAGATHDRSPHLDYVATNTKLSLLKAQPSQASLQRRKRESRSLPALCARQRGLREAAEHRPHGSAWQRQHTPLCSGEREPRNLNPTQPTQDPPECGQTCR